MTSRAAIGLKFLSQFGLRPLALYGLYRAGLLSGHFRRAGTEKPGIEAPPFSPLFSPPGRERLLETLGAEGKAKLLAEAGEILEGRFRMFGGGPVELKLDPGRPLHHWTAYELDPGLLEPHYSAAADIKYLWEPARFGWAFTLGRAWHLTREDRYAEAFWEYFELFSAANPAWMGPHWMNGQEVAIRLMALAWAACVFERAPASSSERRAALLGSIRAHARRIPVTLVYARSQDNNHLVTEAAALYTAGLLFGFKQWRALGWKWLNRALQNQIGAFGEYIQHSANYHRLMLQTVLWVHSIKQDPWPAFTQQALARSAHWLFSILDSASGRVPNLGSIDGALIFPLSASAFDDYRPTVQAAARAFLRTSLHSGPWDEMSLWLGLKAADRATDSKSYLMDNLHAKNSWGFLRAASFRSRLAHMDQLHFDLWWRGLNLAQDAGTYLYHGGPPWDNPLTCTRVHNTVTVDGRDQMTRGGRFMALDWSDAYAKPVIELDDRILHKVKASYNGYRTSGVRHERTVTVFTDETWRVEDRLVNSRRRLHGYRLHWLLPDWEWQLQEKGAGAILRLRSPHGWVALEVSCPPGAERSISLVRAGELVHGRREVLPFEGWASRTYGEKSPALSFAIEVTSPYHTTLVSEFRLPG